MCEKEYVESTESIDQMEIEVEDFSVFITEVPTNSIRITMQNMNDDEEVFYEVKERRLILKHRLNRSVQGFLEQCFKLHRRKIMIELPQAYRGSLLMKTQNGSFKTAGSLNTEQLQLVTTNGSIKVSTLTAKQVTLATKNGSIHTETITGDQITFDTKNGSIKCQIKGTMNDYTIHSKTSNGTNTLPECYDRGSEKQLTAKTCNGTIAIEFI